MGTFFELQFLIQFMLSHLYNINKREASMQKQTQVCLHTGYQLFPMFCTSLGGTPGEADITGHRLLQPSSGHMTQAEQSIPPTMLSDGSRLDKWPGQTGPWRKKTTCPGHSGQYHFMPIVPGRILPSKVFWHKLHGLFISEAGFLNLHTVSFELAGSPLCMGWSRALQGVWQHGIIGLYPLDATVTFQLRQQKHLCGATVICLRTTALGKRSRCSLEFPGWWERCQ